MDTIGGPPMTCGEQSADASAEDSTGLKKEETWDFQLLLKVFGTF
jgi:hypothetical protein